jgi:hypothetical protein
MSQARFILVFTLGVVRVFIGLPRPERSLTNCCGARHSERAPGKQYSPGGKLTNPRVRDRFVTSNRSQL